MQRDDPTVRNLKSRQEAFFLAAERRGFTISVLAQAMDVSPDTLRSYRPLPSREASAMPLAMFIRLAQVHGLTDLCSMLIEDSGHRLAPIEANAGGWDKVATAAAKLTTNICEAREDGQIDHREDARLKELTRTLIAEAQGAVGGG